MANITYEDVVNQIKDRLDILDVVSQEVILKKRGTNWWGLCPFHKEKTPSFSVNPAKGIYKCFGCGEGGDALSFIMKTRGIEFKDLIKELAEKFHIELPASYSKEGSNKDLKSNMIKACKKASEFYQKNLEIAPAEIKRVLDERKINEDIIKEYYIGFAPKEASALYNKLKDEFSDEILEKSGLILKSSKGNYIDRFRNRIIIPIEDENGDIVAFGARAVEDGQNPKYLNSSDSLIYNKSKLLYGLYKAKEAVKEHDSIIIMEGYFDVITAQANGVKNTVASCGTSLTTEHIKLISRYSKSRKIYLAFDTDLAGQNATNRGAEIIKEALTGLGDIKQFDESFSSDDKYSCEIRVISPPEGKDPDEFIRQNGGDKYIKYLQKAPLLIDFQINNLISTKPSTPIEKAKLVKKIITVLSEIQNNIILSEYIKIIALKLDIDENSLTKEVNKFISFTIPETENVKKIVTKNSNILEKTQKNLLSLYLINENHFSIQEISKMIDSVSFSDEKLIIVKNTIDKLACTVNNVKELIEQLYLEFAENEEIKTLITDLICISETFHNLTNKDFKAIIEESLRKIARLNLDLEKEQMRNLYKTVEDDAQALKLQIELRDKINSRRTGDN